MSSINGFYFRDNVADYYSSIPKNSISEFQRIDYLKNKSEEKQIPQSFYENEQISRVFMIGKNILKYVVPDIISLSSLYLSKQFASFSKFGSLLGLKNELDKPCDSLKGIASSIVIITANVFCILEVEDPVNVLFLAAIIASSRAISSGINHISYARTITTTNRDDVFTIQKITTYVKGVTLLSFGMLGIGGCVQNCINGLKPSVNLDKSCKAVIIQGDRTVDEFTLLPLLYENCEVKQFEVGNSDEFCEALVDSTRHLGGKLDVLYMDAHGSNNFMAYTERESYFTGNYMELKCMGDTLSSNAQVFLNGCNTATPHRNGGTTLTTRISKGLPGREITGFRDFYDPFLTTSSYSNGRFRHDNHYSERYGTSTSNSVIEKSYIDQEEIIHSREYGEPQSLAYFSVYFEYLHLKFSFFKWLKS